MCGRCQINSKLFIALRRSNFGAALFHSGRERECNSINYNTKRNVVIAMQSIIQFFFSCLITLFPWRQKRKTDNCGWLNLSPYICEKCCFVIEFYRVVPEPNNVIQWDFFLNFCVVTDNDIDFCREDGPSKGKCRHKHLWIKIKTSNSLQLSFPSTNKHTKFVTVINLRRVINSHFRKELRVRTSGCSGIIIIMRRSYRFPRAILSLFK
jgi:hypothetical protein